MEREYEKKVVVYASRASKVSAACFIAGTIIMTDAGEKPIENIRPGDKVWTYNIESGAQELAEVPNNFSRSAQDFVRLYFAGDSVTCTLEHPFYVDNDWAAAGRLKAGDSLLCYGGAKVAIDSVYKFHTDTAMAVYNLEAAGNHNYYVSASKALAHNECRAATKAASKIWQELKNFKKGIKVRGRGKNTEYLTWDYEHGGEIEVFDRNFNHKGVIHPETGKWIKPSVKGRKLELPK
jgi:hypothetical protein